MKIQEALAHCDIPCKIYDPIVIQIAALTVVRIIDIIEEKKLDPSKSEDSAELSRLTLEKENQARIVKDETRIIWGDYFKEPQIEAFPEIHSLCLLIVLTADLLSTNHPLITFTWKSFIYIRLISFVPLVIARLSDRSVSFEDHL